MIYTVTFNPALDYIVSVPDFQMGRTNRSVAEQIFPGGKGVNVSIVLKNLGVKSIALGFTAGFVGEEIRRRLKLSGVPEEFIPLNSGCSRINFKWKESEGHRDQRKRAGDTEGSTGRTSAPSEPAGKNRYPCAGRKYTGMLAKDHLPGHSEHGFRPGNFCCCGRFRKPAVRSAALSSFPDKTESP